MTQVTQTTWYLHCNINHIVDDSYGEYNQRYLPADIYDSPHYNEYPSSTLPHDTTQVQSQGQIKIKKRSSSSHVSDVRHNSIRQSRNNLQIVQNDETEPTSQYYQTRNSNLRYCNN